MFITTRGAECCKTIDDYEKELIAYSIFDLVLLNIAESDPPMDWQEKVSKFLFYFQLLGRRH